MTNAALKLRVFFVSVGLMVGMSVFGQQYDLKTLGLDKPLAQEYVQSILTDFRQQQGLSEALVLLYQYVTYLGYLTDDWPSKIEHFVWQDESKGMTWRADLNHPRSEYSRSYKKKVPLPEGARCILCAENAGNPDHPKHQYLRVFELALNGTDYFLQPPLTPYMPLHFVLVQKEHTPMSVSADAIREGLAFLDLLPEYTVCSNSDIEDAGATVAGHHHFQIFHQFDPPVAGVKALNVSRETGGVSIGVLDYPATVFYFKSDEADNLATAAGRLIRTWKAASAKNTVNYILRKTGGKYHMWLFPRDVSLVTTPAFKEIKPELIGFIDMGGRLLLADVEDPAAQASFVARLRTDQSIMQIIENGLHAVNPLKKGCEEQIQSLLNAALAEP